VRTLLGTFKAKGYPAKGVDVHGVSLLLSERYRTSIFGH
jgi:hypothetical protein